MHRKINMKAHKWGGVLGIVLWMVSACKAGPEKRWKLISSISSPAVNAVNTDTTIIDTTAHDTTAADTTTNLTLIYFDTESRIRTDSVVQAWIRYTYHSPQTIYDQSRTVLYSEILARFSFDCARRRFRIEQKVYKDPGDLIREFPLVPWSNVIPGTDGESALREACDRSD
jgi:hypothetical protein